MIHHHKIHAIVAKGKEGLKPGLRLAYGVKRSVVTLMEYRIVVVITHVCRGLV